MMIVVILLRCCPIAVVLLLTYVVDDITITWWHTPLMLVYVEIGLLYIVQRGSNPAYEFLVAGVILHYWCCCRRLVLLQL